MPRSRIIRHEAGSPDEHVMSLIYRDHALLWIAVEEVWTMGETESTWERTKIREFRYDGSGQLYMTQTLSTQPAEDPSLIPTGDSIWTEFDGVGPLGDVLAQSPPILAARKKRTRSAEANRAQDRDGNRTCRSEADS